MSTAEALSILRLLPGATTSEIKQAHRDLARVWHPDRFLGDDRMRCKAEEEMKNLNEARSELLSNPSKEPYGTSQPVTTPGCGETKARPSWQHLLRRRVTELRFREVCKAACIATGTIIGTTIVVAMYRMPDTDWSQKSTKTPIAKKYCGIDELPTLPQKQSAIAALLTKVGSNNRYRALPDERQALVRGRIFDDCVRPAYEGFKMPVPDKSEWVALTATTPARSESEPANSLSKAN